MENWQNRHVRIQGDDPIVTFVSPSYFLGEKIRLRCECYNRINFFPPKPWYLYVTHTFQFFGPKNRKHDVKTERGIYLWKCPGRYFRNFILFSKIIWMMDRAAVVSLFCLRNGPPGFSTNSYVRKSDALYLHVQWNQRRKEHTCDDFLTSIFHRFLFWDHLWRDFDATCVLGVL